MIEIRPSDIRWPGPYHVEEGPECLCSRCQQPIEEPDIAIRAWPGDDPNRYSYRFHGRCLGMQGGEPLEDDRWDDDDTPCAYCGEEGCEASCTGAILARHGRRR